MATKLNKSQIWENVQQSITTAINDSGVTETAEGADELINTLLKSLQFLQPKQGGGASTKIDAEGNVYCNYFDEYLPHEEFNTKLSKPNANGERTEGYKANSKTAEQILRKIKALKANVTKQATEAFRTKLINGDEFDTILSNLDNAAETKYNNIDEVPTPADVVGLTNKINS